jgi:hypothetical protein
VDRLTITLREFEKKELTLDARQVRDLAASTAASLQLGVTAKGRYQLKAGNQVGTVVLPSLNVLIRPKVDIPDLFFLLSYARHLRWSLSTSRSRIRRTSSRPSFGSSMPRWSA